MLTRRSGKKTVFFKHLPPVLVIQLQRVAWSNNAARKNNRCIQFQSDLFMDRYLESNAAATTQKRQELELLRKEMANALQVCDVLVCERDKRCP